MTGKEIAGRCLCGKVRYVITGEVAGAFYCHCESCRRAAAAPVVAWGRVNEDQFRITSGKITDFRSSADVVRSRCSECGTEMYYQHDDEKPDLDFPLTTLESPDDIRPEYHVQVAEKLAWFEPGDELPRYQRWRPKSSD